MGKTKKLLMIVLVITLAVILHPTTVMASAGDIFSTGDIGYTVLTETGTTGTVEVSYNYSSGSYYSGNITIPETVGNGGINYTVTAIGEMAFGGCSGLTSISIPDSVTSIKISAFLNCSSLKSISIPKSVTSIGNYAFAGCSGLASISIPYGVTSIENSAFRGCISLASISIPDGVTSIGDNELDGCSGLKSISIPNSVTSIGNSAFRGCSSLTSISIPDGVNSIGSFAFSGCSGLASISIPDGVPSIGVNAFVNCSGLKSISIPKSVTSIGNYAFAGCSGLTSIAFSGSAPPSFGSPIFPGVPAGLLVIVPAGAASVYGTALNGKLPANAAIIEVVSLAAIQGVTPPVSGEAPVSVITGTDQYTGTVTWTLAHNPFAANTIYTATITMTPKAGYTLSGVAANFFTAAGTISVSNAANLGEITMTFPATCLVTYKGAQKKSNGSNYDVRFIATLDTLEPDSVGFVYSASNATPTIGGNNTQQVNTTTVYSSILANGIAKNAASLGGTYIIACPVTGVLNGNTFYVRAYATKGAETKYTSVHAVTVDSL